MGYQEDQSLRTQNRELSKESHAVLRGVLLDVVPMCLATLYVAWSVPFRVAFLQHFQLEQKYVIWWILDYATDVYFVVRWIIQDPNLCGYTLLRLPEHLQSRVAPEQRMGSTQELGSLERLMRREGACERFQERRTLKGFLYHLVATFPLELWGRRTGAASLSLFKAPREWARQRSDVTWAEEDGLWEVVYEDALVNATLNATAIAATRTVRRLRSVAHCYSRAYYWALVTMITTGFGDICPHTRFETIACILSMYVGMSVSCAAIANLTLLVMSGNASSLAHRDKLDDLRQYVSYRKLPEKIAQRMIGYVENQWASFHGLDIDQFEEELPASLRQKTAMVRASVLLRRLPALQEHLVNAAVINALALKLDAYTYAPQDDVIRPGERIVGAILIASGEMDVQQSRVLVQAHSYCEMFWLLRRVFMTVCREQCTPDQLERMSLAAKPTTAGMKAMLHGGFGARATLAAAEPREPKQRSMMSMSSAFKNRGRSLTTRIGRVMPLRNSGNRGNGSSSNMLALGDGAAAAGDAGAAAGGGRATLSVAPAPRAGDGTGDAPVAESMSLHSAKRKVWHRPGTRARKVVESAKFCCLLFYAVATPLAIKTCYSETFKGGRVGAKETLFLALYVVDLYLAADMALRATVLSELESGVLVTKGAGLRRILRKSRFWGLEVLCLFPWDALALSPAARDSKLSWFALLRAAKIPVLAVRAGAQTALIADYIAHRFQISKNMQRITLLNSGMLLFCHWMGCAWILAGRASIRYYDDKRRSWIFIDRGYNATLGDVGANTSPRNALRARYDTSGWNQRSCASSGSVAYCTYLRSVYYAIVGMSTVGYGDIKPDPSNMLETNFSSCMILFGGLLLPAIVGGLASLMADLNKDIREYRAKFSELRLSMQRQKLNQPLSTPSCTRRVRAGGVGGRPGPAVERPEPERAARRRGARARRDSKRLDPPPEPTEKRTFDPSAPSLDLRLASADDGDERKRSAASLADDDRERKPSHLSLNSSSPSDRKGSLTSMDSQGDDPLADVVAPKARLGRDLNAADNDDRPQKPRPEPLVGLKPAGPDAAPSPSDSGKRPRGRRSSEASPTHAPGDVELARRSSSPGRPPTDGEGAPSSPGFRQSLIARSASGTLGFGNRRASTGDSSPDGRAAAPAPGDRRRRRRRRGAIVVVAPEVAVRGRLRAPQDPGRGRRRRRRRARGGPAAANDGDPEKGAKAAADARRCAPKTSTIAQSYADCFELHRDRYFDVLRGFPSSAAIIRDKLRLTCDAEGRLLDAMLGNIARAHHDRQFARRVAVWKSNLQPDFNDALLATDEDSRKLATTPEMLSTVSLKRSFAFVEKADRRGSTLGAASPGGRGSRAGSGLSGFAANARAAALNVDAAAASLDGGLDGFGDDEDDASSTSSRRSVFGGDGGLLGAGGGGRRKRVGRLLARLDRGLRAHVSDPESAGQVRWSGLMVVVVIYHLFSTPVHVAFLTRTWTSYAVDWLFDVVALLDAFLCAFYFGFMHQGILELEKKTIWRHHVESKRLTFDLLTCAPYEIFALFVEDPALRPLIVAFARLPKAAARAYTGNRLGTLFRLLGAVVLVSHWAALAFYTIARYHHVGGDDRADDVWRCTWVRHQIGNSFLRLHSGFGPRDQPEQYLRALNWALPTLVVVVIGDVTPATCFETLCVFICIAAGMSINAMIIGQITAAIADSDASSTELSVRADRLEKYMQQHRVPLKLRSRVNAFMNSLTTATDTSGAITNTASGESLAASTLPHTLRASAEGDLVIQFGDHGEAMHFLLTGTVQVVAENNVTIYATLKAGCYFGEGALFSNVRRTASIQCTCFSESLRLSRSDLQAQLKAFCFRRSGSRDVQHDPAAQRDTNAAISKNLTEARELTSRLSRVVDGSGRAAWETASALFVFYEAVIIPYRAVFTLPDALTATVPGAMGPDYAIDVFFLLSILLRASMRDLSDDASQGLAPVFDGHCVAGDYRRSGWFRLDVAAAAPLELFAVLYAKVVAARRRRLCNLVLAFRLNRLLRLARLNGYFETLFRHATLRHGVRASKAEQALFAVCVCYGYVNHWYACVWFAIHRYLEASTARRTWATEDSLATPSDDASDRQAAICRVNVADCYIRAVHMVITTISSVGYGDIKPVTPLETCWQLVVVVTGACLFVPHRRLHAHPRGLRHGGRVGLQRQAPALRGPHAPREPAAEFAVRGARAPPHRWARTLCIDERAITRDLTAPLRMDLALFVHRAAFERVKVFAALPRSTARRLAAVADAGARESVAAGDVGWDVYFIFHGSVRLAPPADASVLDAQGRDAKAAAPPPGAVGDETPKTTPKVRSFATAKSKDGGPAYTLFSGVLNTGEHFGEFCLQSGSGVRQETAITLAASEFYTISRTDLEDQVVSYESDDVLAMFNDLLQVHKLQPGSPGNAGAGESP
ncbi:cyclic nucleotide-gated ion channel [Aureococcus anophagefferens]|nr:cyclic nucleotide-gated ion channel [Aureococcus anophagefferens]